MSAEPVDVAGLFPAATEEDWRALVEKALAGRPFSTLETRTEDGTVLAPLHRADPAPAPQGRPHAGPWQVVARLDRPDPEAAAAQALVDLENGATALSLVFPDAPTAWGAGLAAFDLDALDRAIAGVLLDLLPIRLEAGGAGRGTAALFAALVERRGLDPATVELHAGLDPLGAFVAKGVLSAPWPAVGRRLADTVRALAGAGFGGTVAAADGRPFHAAGATDATELAAVLANAVAQLRAFDEAGLALEDAAARIGFAIAVDQDQFAGIAKVRALRRLWSRILEDCALPPAPAHVHAETSFRMLTARDPHTNMLRTTIAAFAAGVGGADSVTVLPFTQPLGLPDAFARRVARNTQTILLEESHLAKVIDPAAGSGAVAARTEALCGSAWEVFRAIERADGLPEAIAGGTLAERIAAERRERAHAVTTRRRPIVGTSQYPTLEERPVAVDPAPAPASPVPAGVAPAAAEEGSGAGFRALVAAASAGATLADLAARAGDAATDAPVRVAPLAPARTAAPFERLRDAADAARAAGSEPVVLLVTLGPLARHTVRADWAANLLATGGVRTERTGPVDDPETAARAFGAQAARIACIVGDDEAYAALAEPVARALADAGAAAIYLAGRPGESGAALEAAGVTRFLHAGMDVVAALAGVHADLGIAAARG